MLDPSPGKVKPAQDDDVGGADSGGSSSLASPSEREYARRLVSTYDGAALVFNGADDLIAANEGAAGLRGLLEHGEARDVVSLLGRARLCGGAVIAGVLAPDTNGGGYLHTLEATAIPLPVGRMILLLTRDVSLERNLQSALVESRQRYKDLVEISSDFAWEIDGDGCLTFVSPGGGVGYDAGELIGTRFDDLMLEGYPDNAPPLPFNDPHPVEGRAVWVRDANGEPACLEVSVRPLLDDCGARIGARGVCRDVTQERIRDAALAGAYHRERLLNQIAGAMRDEVDPQAMLIAAATAICPALEATGCHIYRIGEGDADTGPRLVAQRGAMPPADAVRAVLDDLGSEEGEITEVTLAGARVIAAPTVYRHQPNGAIAIWRDATAAPFDDDTRLLLFDVANQLGIANQQAANHERIVNLSRTDSLTGLLNRRAFFDDEVPRRMRRLQASGEPAALVFVDLDNFKQVNDVHGHQRGDEALLAVRTLLIEHSRPGDAIARLGGDEFALWLDGVDAATAQKRAKALLDAAQALDADYSGDPQRPLGFSIGIAVHRSGGRESLDDLLAIADAEMYRVKRAGKGGFGIAEAAATVGGDGGR